jgi:hypothetical protein
MAEHKPGVQGDVAGKPLSGSIQQKIHDVLKSTLKAELETAKPTTGAVLGRHGSVTHGSVIFEE